MIRAKKNQSLDYVITPQRAISSNFLKQQQCLSELIGVIKVSLATSYNFPSRSHL